MAKIWLLAVVALMAVTAIRSEEPAPAVPAVAPVQVAQAKIFVGRPIMRTGDVDRKAYEARQANKVAEENKKDEQPMVKIEPATKVEDASEDNDNTAGETGEAVQGQLSPILPFFNGMSPFMQSIIGSMNGKADEPSQPFEDVAAPESDMPGRPHGVLTVVFMKAIRPAGDGASDEQSKESAFAEARSKISLFLSRFMPRRFSHMFGGDTDPDSQRMKLIGGDDVDRNFMQSRPLLGGDHDLDRFRPFVDESNSDSDSDEMNRGMMNPQIIMRTDSGNQQADLSDDMVRNYPPTNRCVMSFMRLKASAYYRTVVHLLFFSGIILLVLFMIILTIRVYRRRRALRFYNQNMHVATISYEDVPRKTGHGHNLFLFRLGSLRNSYAQKQAEAAAAGEQASEIKSSLLIQSPPAYDQVMVPESSKLGKDDDAQSVISLPAYHEVEKPKSSDL